MFTLGEFMKSNIDIIVLILTFILSGCLFDYRKKNSYKHCKKKCGTDECKEWLCKYYHEPRREYILVSQGVELFRTYDENKALTFRDESNNKWSEYVEKCIDANENYADNEVFIYVDFGKGDIRLWK